MVQRSAFRTYHNLLYVDDCLNTRGLRYDFVSDRRAMEAAIWFHDAVHVMGADNNEEQSAELARACLSSLGGPPEVIDQVAMLILATDHRRAPQGIEAQLVCDIDSHVLGRGIDVYDRYAVAIEAEVGLPAREYAPHRQAFWNEMLAKPRIFHTEHFRRQYETEARINMQRELEHWAARFGE